MAQSNSISSTEKLLDLIRGRSPKASVPATSETAPPGGDRDVKSRFGGLIRMRRKASIGVSIGYTDIKLVKIAQASGANRELLDYRAIDFPPELTPQTSNFPHFLKRVLSEFTRDVKDLEIWSSISSARVEMRYLRIPRVPRRQAANTVYWTFKKEVNFNEKDHVFDFDLLGEITEDGVRKTEVLAYVAPKEEIDQLKRSFSQAGYPLTGISIVPFLNQNLFRNQWIQLESQSVCSLYIGRDWSRIDIFSGGNLVLSRGIKAGMNSMIEAIRHEITPAAEDTDEAEGSEEVEAIYERADTASAAGAEEARRIFFHFIHHPAFSDMVPEGRYSETDVFQMVLPALERLIRQVDRTLNHYAVKFDSESVDKIFISGPVNGQTLMVNTISDQLGLDLDVFDPMAPSSPIARNITPPSSIAKREAFLPAVGLALSSNDKTPNFLFTYKEKQKAESARRASSAIYVGLIFVAVLCIGIFAWQTSRLDQKETELNGLRRELEAYSPRVTEEMISDLLETSRSRQAALKQLGRRYLGPVAVNEITRLTPKRVRLLTLDMRFGAPAGPPQPLTLRIEGIVFGDRLTFESSLAEYLIKLNQSPIFKDFTVQKRTFLPWEKGEVMHFTAEIKLV